ncbi:hypothetical protein HMPREF9334_00841 [Selenomonas infelix ATCC 43532]|jgi:hypothetical protein|uniref:Uncharacterized protein n=1 Tax=Selenomonas infelix ATCC 43532 TaxID=679201 RepID=G5GN87_9FIRM|nr:hypothetical protein [Selenomonas infelix]EHG21424.1 hypothetical protein HMPREF9334_00841 [Selenomonas infelix ATCC 43532]
MRQWKGFALGTLTMLLAAAPLAEAAEDAALTRAEVRASAVADAKAARAAALEEKAAARAADKEARQKERADAIAARKADKEARQQERAAALAERKAAKEERKAALAAAKAERRAELAAEKAERKAARAQTTARNKRERGARYRTLFTDNGFTYYLDVKNTRWIPRPYQSSEYMIDAWVRLVEDTTGAPVAEDGKIRPAKYFLEHYYISPKHRQIMFLSELEVTGRPENAVKERAYDPKNWEQLVPGSIEDDLYEAITARMGSAPGERGGLLSGTSGMSLRDMVEEYARISF